MKTLCLILLLSFSNLALAEISNVNSGQAIEATTINEIITKLNKIESGRYVTKKHSVGNYWYEIYNDGWVRISNIVSVSFSQAITTVNLPITMLNSSYTVHLTLSGFVANGTAQASYQNLTTTNFQIYGDYNSSTGNFATRWSVEGYANAESLAQLGVIVTY